MKRILSRWFLSVMCGFWVGPAFGSTGASATTDPALLGHCYLRFMVYQQVVAQADGLAGDAAPADQDQVKKAATDWMRVRTDRIRGELNAQYGEKARALFEQYVADYTAAEKSGDAKFLAEQSKLLALTPPPSDYAGLRKAAIDGFLQPDVTDGSKWLGEVQTWIDVRKKTPGTPDLSIWLTRNQAPATWTVQKKSVLKKPPEKTLANSEADLGEFTAEEEEPATPLDNFGDMRKKRRDRMLEESQAGMEQVANERQAAEEEYAAKKTAAAQAEAEAMRRQADKLAAVEKDALEQRKNSWGNRLKSIVGATISATTGAFTGGLGTRAGQEAANAIFKDN